MNINQTDIRYSNFLTDFSSKILFYSLNLNVTLEDFHFCTEIFSLSEINFFMQLSESLIAKLKKKDLGISVNLNNSLYCLPYFCFGFMVLVLHLLLFVLVWHITILPQNLA